MAPKYVVNAYAAHVSSCCYTLPLSYMNLGLGALCRFAAYLAMLGLFILPTTGRCSALRNLANRLPICLFFWALPPRPFRAMHDTVFPPGFLIPILHPFHSHFSMVSSSCFHLMPHFSVRFKPWIIAVKSYKRWKERDFGHLYVRNGISRESVSNISAEWTQPRHHRHHNYKRNR